MSKNKDWETESPVMGPRRYWPPTGGKRPDPPAPSRPAHNGQSPAQQPKRDSDDKR